MVVFSCNTCGDSLKKSEVEKHYYTKCRNSEVLTCLDCNKDFWGDAYKEHNKCVTEQERYGGKGFKAQVFKGEVKQQEWINLIASLISTGDMPPRVQDILQRMQSFDNIPRKNKPFKNFLKSSLGVHNDNLAEDVWQTIEKFRAKQQQSAKRTREDANAPEPNGAEASTFEEETAAKRAKTDDEEAQGKRKFKWKKALKVVLRNSEGQQLSLKKLRKRVFAEYRQQGGHLEDEEMQAKFDKVLGNTAYFEQLDGKVHLVHS